MAHVTVTVNDKSYTLACDDGEEEHLAKLVRQIDRHVVGLKSEGSKAGDAQLLLMAGLVLADDLELANERVQELEEEIAGLKNEFLGPESKHATARANAIDEDKVAGHLESAARRMEDIAGRLG